MKKLIIITGISLFCIGWFWLMAICFGKPGLKGKCRINYLNSRKSFRGVVVDKIYDSKNHTSEQVFLENGEVFEWDDRNFLIYNKIQIGDSLVKDNGSLFLEVYSSGILNRINMKLECEN